MRAMRVLGALAALSLLVGCGLFSPPPEPPKLLTRAQADARTVVPFTRGVRLDKAGRIVDVIFDAPEAGPYAIPTLIIGLRSEAAEQAAALEMTARVRARGLKARVNLQRLDSSSPESVPLRTIADDGLSLVTLPTDMMDERLRRATVALYPLAEAGLYSEHLRYSELQFASAWLGETGRYRLRIELIEDRPDLEGLEIEVIVGYQQRGK